MTRTRALGGLNLLLIAVVYGVCWTVVQGSGTYGLGSIPAWVIAVDLVVTAAAIQWLVGVRGAGLPMWTVGVVALAGSAVVGWWIPTADGWGWTGLVMLAAELGAVALMVAQGVKALRAGREAHGNRWDALTVALTEATGSRFLAIAAVTEAQLLSYAVIGPFRAAPKGPGVFSMHREIGWVPMVGMFQFISAVEIPLVHIVVDAWLGPWVAWPLAAASAYGAVWLWADAQAVRLRQTRVENRVLMLRVGLRWSARIPLHQIAEVVRSEEKATVDCSVFGSPVVTVSLRQPVTLNGLFGWKRRTEQFSLQVDEVDAFIAAVSSAPPE